MDWDARIVLVTGATGIIGSWLVKTLISKGCKVVAFAKDFDQNSEFVRSDTHLVTNLVCGRLEDYSALEDSIIENKVDTVFHLGAQPIVGIAYQSPLMTFESNIRGTYNLLEACRRLGPEMVDKVVIASSDKAYGAHQKLPYVEDMELRGRQPYEVSKSCADLLAQSYAFSYDLPVAIVRAGNVYGGGDFNWDRIVPGTMRSVLNGNPPVIRTDGSFVRDYLYVKDLADGYLRVAEQLNEEFGPGEAFNFSNGNPVKVIELVELIQRVTSTDELLPEILGTATREIQHQHLSSDKAKKILGWSPKFNLRDGLLETATWYKKFFDDPGQNFSDIAITNDVLGI